MKKALFFVLLLASGILVSQSCKKKTTVSPQDQQYTDSMNTFLKLLVNNWHIDHIAVTPNFGAYATLPLDSLGLNTVFTLGYSYTQINPAENLPVPNYQNQTNWKNGTQAVGNILERYLVHNSIKYPGERINTSSVVVNGISYDNSNESWTASAMPNTLYLQEDAYGFAAFDNHQGKTYKVVSINSKQMVLTYNQLQYTVTKYYLAQ